MGLKDLALLGGLGVQLAGRHPSNSCDGGRPRSVIFDIINTDLL